MGSAWDFGSALRSRARTHSQVFAARKARRAGAMITEDHVGSEAEYSAIRDACAGLRNCEGVVRPSKKI